MGGIVRFVKWAVKRRRKARHGEMERRVPGWLSCRVQLAQHDILHHSSLLNIPSLTQTNTATSYVHTLLPCSVSACPTSIPSTPKMIICLRQIILGKAIYRITIALLCPPSQTSSLECVWGKPQKKRFCMSTFSTFKWTVCFCMLNQYGRLLKGWHTFHFYHTFHYTFKSQQGWKSYEKYL